jgi:hypothetical protein
MVKKEYQLGDLVWFPEHAGPFLIENLEKDPVSGSVMVSLVATFGPPFLEITFSEDLLRDLEVPQPHGRFTDDYS